MKDDQIRTDPAKLQPRTFYRRSNKLQHLATLEAERLQHRGHQV